MVFGRMVQQTDNLPFTLEPYVNGTPAPSLVTKEVDMVVEAPFLLANPDFSKTEVVKTYVHKCH